MDAQHNIFVIALLFVSIMIWQAWQIDHAVLQSIDDHATDDHATKKKTGQPLNIRNGIKQDDSLGETDQFLIIETDVLSLKINKRGGDIEQADLLTYRNTLDASQPFHLLETSSEFVYQAQSGLIGKDGPDNMLSQRPLYTTHQDTYRLPKDKNELRVPLTYIHPDGIVYTKTFILKRSDFALNISYSIQNNSFHPIEGILCGRLKQSMALPKNRKTVGMGISNLNFNGYRGAAYSTENKKYQKYSFKDIKDANLNTRTEGGWIAMLQQYFATAWIPITPGEHFFYTMDLGNGIAVVEFQSEPVIVHPNQKKEMNALLWVGPEIQDKMASVAPYLDLTVDYGLLWFISQPLFKLLQYIQSYIINWGFSIIIITFIVRFIMYPLTKAQYTAMAKIRMLQPKMLKIRERFREDKQRQSQEMMALYRDENVNPLGGCLPLIIQMPIFLALYYMLSCSVELRHAPFILWIRDLSSPDPYYLLPILMGITMFCMQKISPSTATAVTDPIHRRIMTLMPMVFTIFFFWFPSGLVLYYIVSNLVTIIQQQIIYRSLEKQGLHRKHR